MNVEDEWIFAQNENEYLWIMFYKLLLYTYILSKYIYINNSAAPLIKQRVWKSTELFLELS